MPSVIIKSKGGSTLATLKVDSSVRGIEKRDRRIRRGGNYSRDRLFARWFFFLLWRDRSLSFPKPSRPVFVSKGTLAESESTTNGDFRSASVPSIESKIERARKRARIRAPIRCNSPRRFVSGGGARLSADLFFCRSSRPHSSTTLTKKNSYLCSLSLSLYSSLSLSLPPHPPGHRR